MVRLINFVFEIKTKNQRNDSRTTSSRIRHSSILGGIFLGRLLLEQITQKRQTMKIKIEILDEMAPSKQGYDFCEAWDNWATLAADPINMSSTDPNDPIYK